MRFLLGSGGVQGLAAEEVTGASSDNRLLEEVVVTASKRGAGTRIQDTAMAISAIGADAIDKRGLVGMADYLPSLPGVSMQDRGATHNSIVMRGISSDPESESQAVGVYFGETPITGLGSAISFAGNADIKMVDIEQVEVLRGPQGTLYGAASMGGAVRVIPMSPKLGEWEGEIAGSYSKTGEGGDDNNMLRSIINIPLVDDSLALRAVVYHFDNSGYIESGSTDGLAALAAPLASGGVPSQRKEIGGDEYTGGRIAGLWQASDALDFTLTYTQQEVEQDGFPEVSLALDDKFQQPRLRTGALGSRDEFLSNEIKITNLLFNYQLDWGSITSSSSWIDYEANISIDLSHVFGIPANADGYNNTESFIEEIRFSSDLNGSIQFLAGFYYEDNKKINPVTIASSGIPPIPFFIDQDAKLNTEQQAVFGELRYTFNEQLEATLGARYFEYEQEDILNATGAFTASGRTLNEDEGDNYKFNLSYTPTEDYLVYFQWAEGFRLGAPQAPLTSACDIDEDGLVDGLNIALKPIEPDELESFEIGVKASFADNRISLNAAVYRINWQGMPVTLSPPCNVNVRINAGESKSEGIELELQASLTERLHLSMSASYGEATLTEDIPLVTGFWQSGRRSAWLSGLQPQHLLGVPNKHCG